MYIIKNAIKNLKRNLSRNILMLVILVLVIVGSVVALSIKSATSTISQQYRDQIGAEVTIETNNEKYKQTKKIPKPITMDQYQKLSESDLVKSFSFFVSMPVESKDLKGVGEDQQPKDDPNQGMAMVGLDENNNPKQMDSLPTTRLVGATGSDSNSLIEFANGQRTISEGRGLENNNEVLISEEFAKLNNLKIGDTIKLINPQREDDPALEVKIVGIYEDFTSEYSDPNMQIPYLNRRNEIITTFDTTRSFFKSDNISLAARFVLNSPNDLEAFTNYAREIGITDDYNLTTDEASFQKAVAPLESLDTIMSYFIVIMLVVSAGVLLLLSFLSIRERQYEIGVLRAMGMKKGSVAFGFMTESFIILILSIVIGIGIGSMISNPVANNLLEQQLTNLKQAEEKNKNANTMMMSVQDNKREIDPIDSIEASVNYQVIIQISMIGIVLVLISNAVAISYITKFEPIEIMRKKD